MVSRARVDPDSTTTGIGVSSVYKKHRFLRSQPFLRSTMAFPKTSSSSNIHHCVFQLSFQCLDFRALENSLFP